MRLAAPAVCLALAVGAGGCGDGGAGEEREAPRSTPTAAAAEGVDVRVTMGDAPGPERYTARCADAACVARWKRLLARHEDPARACIELYGGPETARARGTVGGRPVDVRFGREDGCAIESYEALFRLLGRPAPVRE